MKRQIDSGHLVETMALQLAWRSRHCGWLGLFALLLVAGGCGSDGQEEDADEVAEECPSGQQACAGRCVDLSSDASNCGTCAITCGAGQICVAGICAGDGTGGALGMGGAPGAGGTAGTGGAPDSGGAQGTGGAVGLGGQAGTGGSTPASGGAPAAGGQVGSGGDVGAGGSGVGGRLGMGGDVGTGGAAGTGGDSAMGGLTSAGGVVGSGGELGTGGEAGTGGNVGVGGVVGTGGEVGTGGNVGTGGDPSTGGTGGEGPVDCTFVPDPSLAAGETGAVVGATAAHNQWRVRVGVPRVRWNAELAAGAQAYADTCPSGHSTYDYRADTGGFALVGECLWGGSDVLAGIAAFVAERADYDFGTVITESNYLDFGHYTQVVWEETTDIGCAVGDCGTYPTVCWYGATGNYTGETPYDYSEGECLDLDNDDAFQFEDADDTNRDVQ